MDSTSGLNESRKNRIRSQAGVRMDRTHDQAVLENGWRVGRKGEPKVAPGIGRKAWPEDQGNVMYR